MPKENLTIHLPDGPAIELVYVQGGTFMMGSDDTKAHDREKPAHQVKLSDFYIGKYPVTQKQWQAVTGENPSEFQGEKRPVKNVSWDDAQGFLEKLNQLAGKKFRLPTEAEWEFAARGGIYSQGYKYAGSDRLKQVGWYIKNSNNKTQKVGLLLPNELALYDMSGNVWELCLTHVSKEYREKIYKNHKAKYFHTSRFDSHPVLRGGSSFNSPAGCRPIKGRIISTGDLTGLIGFRLTLSA
ncbi:MAG: formylglycine-generating enzyme family protein [Candidatus Electrothrix sp. AR1]|nr:formylglycine-generating enzyme family protein [Candidatus Electrothrix sp. AR1]